MSRFYCLMGVNPGAFDPDHRFVTSWLLPPLLLACLRTLISLYAFTTIIYTWVWQGVHHDSAAIRETFDYFTDLTFFGIAFYFFVAANHSWVYVRHGYPGLEKWSLFLQALHTLFYTTIITFPFLVTLVYWIVLYSGIWFTVEFDAWSNISHHGLNSFFALLELILPATNPPPWLHLAFLILILVLYLALAYVVHATEGFYVYSFLDPSHGKGKVAGYAFGIAAAIIIIFLVVWVITWVRRRLTGLGKKSRKDTTRATRPTGYEDIEIVEERAK